MAYSGRGPTYKVVLLGELGVGKTSLFKRLKDNTFDEYQTATTGIDSCTKVMKVENEQVMVSDYTTMHCICCWLLRNIVHCISAFVFVGGWLLSQKALTRASIYTA